MRDTSNRDKILVVDDSPMSLRSLVEILTDDYEVSVATSGEQALVLLESMPLPDLILLDIVMPGMSGYEVCSRLKAKEITSDIPVIFLSALDTTTDESKGLELGAVDYIAKPFSPSIVTVRIKNHLELKRHRDRLEELVRDRTKELMLTQTATFTSLGTLAEFRDPETGYHIQRTSKYVQLIAERLAKKPDFSDVLSPVMIDRLVQSAPLHDIGKVGIPDSILLKKGKLEPKEFELMKTHTILGYKALKQASSVLGSCSFLDVAMDLALSHHERWDGKGYPRNLADEKIPLAGRIMAVADMYDALTSARPYKPPFSHEKSKAIMCSEMDGHFDPRIMSVFLELEDDFKEVATEYADTPPRKKSAVAGA